MFVKGHAFRRAGLAPRNRQCPASEFCNRLLNEVRAWQPAPVSQQDDITLIVLDVLQEKEESVGGEGMRNAAWSDETNEIAIDSAAR